MQSLSSLGDAKREDGATLGWGTTTDDSGPGVADGYNASYITDNGFFPNKPTPPPNNGGPIFQMEVSGVATPEPSTWALMVVGLAGLGLLARRRRSRSLQFAPDLASVLVPDEPTVALTFDVRREVRPIIPPEFKALERRL